MSSSDGGSRQWMRTGTPFAKPCTKGVEGQTWEALLPPLHRELHQAVGAKKPGDSQKAKALWTMTAAREREDDFFMTRPIKKTFRTEPELDWKFGKNTLKSPAALAEALECSEAVSAC